MRETVHVDTDAKVRREIEKVADGDRSGDVLWRLRSDDGAVDVTYGDPSRPFFIASATKLYVTAILAQLKDEGRLRWTTPIGAYLPHLDLTGIVVRDHRDLGAEITVQQVMAHMAGLPDYFEGKRPGGDTTFARALRDDFGWEVTDVLAWSREIGPGAPGRGRYSDTGYQLLGALIEQLDGRSFAESVHERICSPLRLADTYVFGVDDIPATTLWRRCASETPQSPSPGRWLPCRPMAALSVPSATACDSLTPSLRALSSRPRL